jgi:hypothetical protein
MLCPGHCLHDGRKRVVFTTTGTNPLSNYVTFSGLYAYSGMTIDGATVVDSDENGTGPTLRDMPLGAGASGTPTLDPIAWD